jgi:hypothetical protein
VADGSIPGHTIDELRAPSLRQSAQQARANGSSVLVFIQPARDASGAEIPKLTVETIVIDGEHAMQSIGGRAPIVGEWRARELSLLVYGEAEAIRYTLSGQLLR